MDLKSVAHYLGVEKETQNIFKDDYEEEYSRIKKLTKDDIVEEYMQLFKKYIQLKEDSNNVDLIKEELDYKKEMFRILLHKYEYISSVNIEYLKRYGEIKGLGVKK